MKKLPLIHPFLFAIFPVLALFAHNVGLVPISETLVPAAIVLGFAAALMSSSWVILRDHEKAGIVVSAFLVLFFSFGHVFDSVRNWQIGSFVLGEHVYWLLTIWGMLFACYAYFLTRAHRNLHNVTQLLNIVSVFLVLIPLMSIGTFKFRSRAAWPVVNKPQSVEIKAPALKRTDLPDIYYIILDSYADSRTLKDIYNFDNRHFLDYLSHRGFYIASESKSNYLRTAHSLASSLNMEYINYLGNRVGEPSNNWLPLHAMLQDHKIWRFLKTKGYKFIHFGTWWQPTRRNKYADRNFNLDPLPQLFYVLYQTTMFYPIGLKLGILDPRLANWKRIFYQFDKLAEIPKIKEPTFVFAHMLITHEPYSFDHDGQFLTIEKYFNRAERDKYIKQVIFANRKLKDLIDKLLASSDLPPIILLQSDEGPWPQRYLLDERNFDWRRATPEELRQKMGILNAYYLPNVDKSALYSSITPVNSFRLIFNHYFGTDMKLLPDKNYAFVDQRHPYSFFDVTDIVARE